MRIENYLEAHDPYVDAYGAEKKQKIALALYVGYPNDAYGDYATNFKETVTPDEARYVTQNLLWDITNNKTPDYAQNANLSAAMRDYYEDFYKSCIDDFVEGTEFFPSSIQLDNSSMTVRKTGDGWEIGPFSLNGIQGASFEAEILTTDHEMNIYHLSGGPISDLSPLIAGEPFILKTPNDPAQSSFGLSWQCDSAKFYFYEHQKGGKGAAEGETKIQNLIRVEPVQDSGTVWFCLHQDSMADRFGDDDQIDITLKKQWIDAPPEDISSVKVCIFADGVPLVYGELKKEYNWTETFTAPGSHMSGDKISYSVEEAPVPSGYTSTVTGDTVNGFVITNAKGQEAPGLVPEKFSISVEKHWHDADGGEMSAPADIRSVTIDLLADDVLKQTLTLTADNNWKASAADLEKYRPNGTEICYVRYHPQDRRYQPYKTMDFPEPDLPVQCSRASVHGPEKEENAVGVEK